MDAYVPILVLGAIAVVFAVFSVGVSSFVGPRRYNRAKLEAYECGIEATQHSMGRDHHGPAAGGASGAREVLPHRDVVHHLRHRNRLPVSVGRAL